MSEIFAKDESPFLDPRFVDNFLAVAEEQCPDKKRRFEMATQLRPCTRFVQELEARLFEQLKLEANIVDC